MKKTPILMLVLTALAALALVLVPEPTRAPIDGTAATVDRAPAASRSPERVPGEYIVVYRDSAVANVSAETEDLERQQGFEAELQFRSALEGFSASLTARQVDDLEADPDVDYVTPDQRFEAVASSPLADGEPTPPAGVRRIEAATSTSVRESSGANVAVVDSGVDLDHPDLDVTNGVNCAGTGPADDEDGHGTHVAGTIAAENDGAGVVGVVPGTKLYAVRVLDATGSGTTSQIVCGIDWITRTRTDGDRANDIDVANMSLGGVGSPVKDCSTTTDAMHQAICRSTAQGVSYVVAAGNDGWDFDHPTEPDVPAAYPEVLTVTASADADGEPGGAGPAPACRPAETDDEYASFSNFAATPVGSSHSVAGPGVCIRSTWPDGYDTISGTSMASPHVAGVVAACLDEGAPCAGETPARVIDRVRAAAEAKTAGDPTYGFRGDPADPVAGRYYGHLAWAGVADAGAAARSSTTVDAGAVTVQIGTRKSGSAEQLAADDDRFYRVDSTKRGKPTTSWSASFGKITDPSSLEVSYRGSNSRRCTQAVSLYRFADSRWVTLDRNEVGATEKSLVGLSPASGPASAYVSTTGQARVRVRCSRASGTFTSRADLMQVTYE